MKKQSLGQDCHDELPTDYHDPLISFLHRAIRIAVKVLAILMVFVIILGVGDVIFVLYQRLMTPPKFLLSISDILETFGVFLVVLIAIEIFLNITLYIKKNDMLPVKLVIATALMAVSRKVIIFDFNEITPIYISASAAVILALGVTYWLISIK